LQKIIPLLPPLETIQGVKLDDELLQTLAHNSQKTLKKLLCPAMSDVTECKAISLCRQLEEIDLSQSSIKDEDFYHVTSCLGKALTSVNLSGCVNISNETIRNLLQRCKRLRVLRLTGTHHVFPVMCSILMFVQAVSA
jgi:hypothetical protein